jgi:hypothetical protein
MCKCGVWMCMCACVCVSNVCIKIFALYISKKKSYKSAFLLKSEKHIIFFNRQRLIQNITM